MCMYCKPVLKKMHENTNLKSHIFISVLLPFKSISSVMQNKFVWKRQYNKYIIIKGIKFYNLLDFIDFCGVEPLKLELN